MYKHILIATDGSELAAKAVTTGLQLAATLGAGVTCITATEPWTAMVGPDGPALVFPMDEYERHAAASTARILEHVSNEARGLGVECATVHATEFPADAIIAAAKENKCDLIVMASHGRRGISQMLLGSQAAKVVTLSTIPVLICR